MKTIVSVQEIDELEIKPAAEVAEWRRLVAAEASRWTDRSGWIRVGCPCCDRADGASAFAILSIEYVECAGCGTVYASHRPSEDLLRDWYRTSPPACFLRDRLLAASGEARAEKIVRPRAQWVLDGIAEYRPSAQRLIDISINGRALIDTVIAAAPMLEASAAGAAADLEGRSMDRVTVNPATVRMLADSRPADLITAVDAFDRAADLPGLIGAIRRALTSGGLLFATLPVASGFEVQALWSLSPTVSPPDRLNLPSIRGLMNVFSQGWELLELSTPGMFDLDIVRRTMAASPAVEWPRVLRTLVLDSDPASRQLLTEFLQSRRLTSFARLVARRID